MCTGDEFLGTVEAYINHIGEERAPFAIQPRCGAIASLANAPEAGSPRDETDGCLKNNLSPLHGETFALF